MKAMKAKRQQSTRNLRSVGAKPYDFNRLKYTTSYRAFGRKSLPHIDGAQPAQNNKQQLNINLSEKQKQKVNKANSRKKISKMIDKWKQRYEIPYNISVQNELKKKNVDYFPPITRISPIHTPLLLLSTKSKFQIFQKPDHKLKRKVKINIQKLDPEKMTEEQVEQIFRKYQSVPNIDRSKQSLYQNTKDENNSDQNMQFMGSYAKRFRYSLQVQRKFNMNFKKKVNIINNNGTESLQQVQQIPQRWEINGEEDNEKYNHPIIEDKI